LRAAIANRISPAIEGMAVPPVSLIAAIIVDIIFHAPFFAGTTFALTNPAE